MGFTKLPPIQGRTACLVCGCGSHDTLDLSALLAVGFGSCNATKDGRGVYDEGQHDKKGDYWTCEDMEKLAAQDPDCDWRVHFFAPLYEAHYQRQGDKHWVLIEKGDGFA